jgi:hypothetical protein
MWRQFATITCTLSIGIFAQADAACAYSQDKQDKDGVEFFVRHIEPVFKQHCYKCHSATADSLEAELRLDSREAILSGGDSGPGVDSKRPSKSLLLQALRHEGGLEMPPDEPALDKNTIEHFEAWIRMGLPMPDAGDNPLASGNWSTAKQHWAFQPVRPIDVPHVVTDVKGNSWGRSPIDPFVLRALTAQGWKPSEESSRRDWIRRVHFDLIGLPPGVDEVEDFVKDRSPKAYERVVDRLLSSPHYGEKWAQYWLDLVRYAESEGYEYDRHLPGAWRYRDYVVNALNRDLPYDEFVTDQLAGDELGGDERSPDDLERRSAAIFHRLGPVRRNAGNPEIALSRNEVLTERTDIIGDVFLGLSVRCARCHHHKLEPITQRDYYRLQAYLAATREHNVHLVDASRQQAWEKETKRIEAEVKVLKKQIADADEPQASQLRQDLVSLENELPQPLPTIPTIRNEPDKRTVVHVLRRGDWDSKGVAVAPRPLSVLVSDDMPELAADRADARTELAKWLTTRSHPLTARVMVNRIWQHHFGRGLVATPNDFGTQGAPPSHPELLDWLAKSFVDGGWRSKPIHRTIVLSATYRQSSDEKNSTAAQEDPDNRLLWRFSRRRLKAEELRDAMLAVSGDLNSRIGGPSVIIPVDKELVQLLYKPSQWRVTDDLAEHNRLSVYLMAKRNLRLPFMEVFDAPALLSSCPTRQASTHAPQALELLNGEFANTCAAALARRLQVESDGDQTKLVQRAFVTATGRPPTTEELRLSLEFLRTEPLGEFALAIFNLNGFLYVR